MLEVINSPADLRGLDLEDLPTLCNELREFLLHSVANGGGHFSWER